jgi:hypothetical protein
MSIRGMTKIVALLLLAVGLYAQDQATLTGTVTDPSGSAIPNATVKAVNTATNNTSETKTTSDGIYTIPYLIPGVYNVEVTAAGFQILKRPAVTLAVAQRLNMNLQMTVGQSTTEITVTGQQEIIDTGSADRGLVFDPIKTQEYPLNGRQSYMLLALTPGVIFGQEQFGASGFSGTRGWDVNSSYKFNGARQGNGNNVFMMNGTPISDNGSTWEFAPSVDAIQEFKAQTTVFDASIGHEAGGVVNTVIKGGTNSWHGDVYDYFRNGHLDANNFGNNYAGAPKGNHHQNQFGGVLGGPIRKDKDFLFTSYEGWQETIPFPGSGVQAVPLDLRNGQNFSNYNMLVYDPLTTHPCTAGSGAPSTEPCSGSNGSQYWRNQFPGNVIPPSRISPIATKILSYLPAPNTVGQGAAGITGNYLNPGNTGRYWYNQPIVRWDHNFGEKDKFYALFSEFHGYEYRSTSTFPKPVAQGNIDNNRTFTGLNLDETHVLSPSAVLDVKASFFRFVQLTPGYSDQAQAITAQSIGMTNMIHAPTVDKSVIPNIFIGGFTGPLFGSGSFSWTPYNRWILNPSVTWTKGRHTLHFGFEGNYESRGNVSPGNAYGAFTFLPSLTQQATDRTINNTDQFLGIATLLLGMPTYGTIDNNASYYLSREYYAWFAQDTWKVTNRLTLDIGLRYEFQLPYLERYNRQSSEFDINQVNPLSSQILSAWNADKAAYDATNPKYPYPTPPAALLGVWGFAGVNGLPRRQRYTDYTNGAPRIGFAYRVNDKTVVRGGIGVYYQSDTNNGNGQTGFSLQTVYQSGFTGGQYPSACFNDITGLTNNQCASGPPTGPYSLVNPFPKGLTTAAGPAAGALANIGQGSTTNILHYKIPRTYQYTIGIQRQLPGSIVLDVSYAGNNNRYNTTGNGHDLGHVQDAQGIANQQLAMQDPTFFTRQLANPFYGIPGIPLTTGIGSSTTRSADNLMNQGAFALWSGYSDNDIAARIFRSDALQLSVQKRAGGDSSALGSMTFVLSYTFSKQMFWDCCIQGNGWLTNTGTVLKLSPDGTTGTLQNYPIKSAKDLFYWQPDSANKPQEIGFSGVWDLPIGKGRHFANSVHGAADKVISGWTIPWTVSYISGSFVGLPNAVNYCGDYTHYIDPVTGKPTGQTQDHWFNNNPNCYTSFPTNNISTQLPPRFSGNVENPASPQFNIALEKNTTIHERYRLQFRAESFNIANSPIRPGPGSTTFNNANFGLIPKVQNNFPRLIELAMKLYF